MVEVSDIKGTTLAAAIKAVMPCAGKDQMLPVLCAVHFTAEAGALALTTTDRFTVARDRIDGVTVTDAGSFLLHTDDVKRLVALVKADKYGGVRFAADDAGNVTVTTYDGSATFRGLDGDFPRTDRIIANALDYTVPSGEDTPAQSGQMGVNMDHLARFATKNLARDRSEAKDTVRLTLPTKNGGALAVTFSDHFVGIVMGRRLDFCELRRQQAA